MISPNLDSESIQSSTGSCSFCLESLAIIVRRSVRNLIRADNALSRSAPSSLTGLKGCFGGSNFSGNRSGKSAITSVGSIFSTCKSWTENMSISFCNIQNGCCGKILEKDLRFSLMTTLVVLHYLVSVF
eukprot:Pompholyxophrys_punicea_v1_NODE_1731_length_577_cov_1.166667.p2 type:complete len:129 gc:universal NODE_1731_length_577_cov_1.166667:127-513(+)